MATRVLPEPCYPSDKVSVPVLHPLFYKLRDIVDFVDDGPFDIGIVYEDQDSFIRGCAIVFMVIACKQSFEVRLTIAHLQGMEQAHVAALIERETLNKLQRPRRIERGWV